jgi:hypothetical protein
MLVRSLDAEKLKQIGAKTGDPALAEKVHRAFCFLETLVKEGFEFVFKGGSAVMLLLDQAQRFSIDIDIIYKNELSEELLSTIINDTIFLEIKKQKRHGEQQVPKSHFKVYYKSILKSTDEKDFILLDVLHDDSAYPALQDTQICLPFLPSNGESLTVKTPTIGGICGDKLTAFAPSTIGIPYSKNGQSCAFEIAKQMFDIGCLFNKIQSIQDVASAFGCIGKKEAHYRNMTFDAEEVIADILNTSLTICTEGNEGKGNFSELKRGITSLKSYVFSRRYSFQNAQTDAAKAAYLAGQILVGGEKLSRFEPTVDLKSLKTPQKQINALKKSAPEAFYYWYKIFEIAQISQQTILLSLFDQHSMNEHS